MNPFPGLRAFEPEENDLFFGRERQIDELLRRLRETHFLSVLGTSGSGKSSLVRSGLIPSLHGGAMTRAGSSWRVAILRPGDTPLANLATALAAPECLGAPEGADDLAPVLFETTLRASKRGLLECVQQARIPAHHNVLVLVDQFEELFRFKSASRSEASRDEAVAFVKLLLEAAQSPEVPLYVALTMRSDFVGNCMEFAGLPEAINEGLFLVPRMSRDELRLAITGPVAVVDAAIAPRLVSRLLNDVGDDQDQLPILQHAMMRTWDLWEADHAPDEPLDLRHYEATGTLAEALSRHAEEAYSELDKRGQEIAKGLFKALTDRGTDGRGIRRPVSLGEIATLAGASETEVTEVVERFRPPGRSFLMPPAGVPLKTDTILDLSHESLMRIWTRLVEWVKDEARSAQIYLGIARAAALHEEGQAALWRDPELQLALTWRENEQPTEAWARRYDPAFERAMRFLDESADARQREADERDESRRRELRRARWLVVILGTAALITLGLGSWAFVLKNQAETALKDAREQRQEAENQRQKAVSEAQRGDREKIRAQQQKDRAERQTTIAQRESKNAKIQSQNAEKQRQLADEERKRAEAESLKAQASEASEKAARLYAEGKREEAEKERKRAEDLRIEAEESEREAKRLSRLSWARALAPQITTFVTGDTDNLLARLALVSYRLHHDNGGSEDDPDQFNALRTALLGMRKDTVLRGHQDGVRALSLGIDGSTLITGSEDGKIRRFDLRNPSNLPTDLGAFGEAVRSLALTTDGRFLAAGSAGGSLRVWDLSRLDAPPIQISGSGPIIGALAFQPRSSLLAAGTEDGAVRIWNLGRPQSPVDQLEGDGKRISALVFTPDGERIIVGKAGGGASSWSFRQPASKTREIIPTLDVRSIELTPDGTGMAVGVSQGAIFIMPSDYPPLPVVVLSDSDSSVNSLSFSPQGDLLASASSDGTVRLWNLKLRHQPPIVFKGHNSWVWSVKFDPTGNSLVSGSNDKTVHIWPTRSDRMFRELCKLEPRGLTPEEWDRFLPKDLPYQSESPCKGIN